jgi:glycolate oxidase
LKYTGINEEIIERLKRIVGKGGVFTGKEEREKYSYDEMCLPKPHLPSVVVKPKDKVTVANILKLADEKRIPVTPRGAGTGACGGSIPIFGGILLSLEKMDKILEVDKENFLAVVEPGVILGDLYKAVEEHGLYYPLYPGEISASIGGNVATNAGGMRAVKYGVTRQFVLGVEAVLPTGEVIETGGKFVKSSTAYDLTQLLVGSEGTLAVITKVILKLITAPKRKEVLFIPFTNLYDAIKAVPDILKHGIFPMGIEFMEREVIKLAEEYTNREIPYHDYEAFLLVILEGESEDEIYVLAERVEEICTKNGAVDVFIPTSERAKRELLDAREKMLFASKSFVSKHSGVMDGLDIVVPRNKIPEFMERAKEISQKHEISFFSFGHAGDGNIHFLPFMKEADEDTWNKESPDFLKEIYQAGVSLGGTISAEHGIGFDKKKYLNIAIDEKQIDIMKRIKKVFDPNNILNPGKIFDL